MLKDLRERIRTMDPIRKKYLTFTLSIFLVFSVLLTIVFTLQFDKINAIHAENTREQIVSIKMEFLEDSVNNTIGYIEEMKTIQEDRFKSRIQRLAVIVQDEHKSDRISNVQSYLQSEDVHEDLVVVIKDPQGNLLYESPTAEALRNEELQGAYFVKEEWIVDDHSVVVGALDCCVKKQVETALRNRLYQDVYFDEAYIWVNQVLDYKGGTDYALRLIHPNLKDTEGTLLSTDMEDVAGGKPYLEELEGVKADGELFFTYYFKKLTSDRLEKKITFAKLYKEYDWIIAMGIYYDNLEEYIRAANAKTREERAVALSFVALSGLILLLVAALLYLWAERIYYDRATEPLKTEVETDLLTGARSRRSALKALSTGFLDFKNHGGLYHLLVLDLGDFKQVNDTHGHEVGDRVLQRVVDSIKQVIRTEDQIYRWGGEEFILFVRGIPEDNLHYFVDKVLKAVEGSTCKKEALEIKTTISIGVATFKNSDQGYEDVLKRADDALYESKRTGKNKGTIC